MKPKVRKGTSAIKTRVHVPKKVYKRTDKIDREVYEDWFEQILEETKRERKEED